MPEYPNISVIVPAYNEELTIEEVVTKLTEVLDSHGIVNEIIVVDDGSTDATLARAQATNAVIVKHERNRGYGATLKTGILAARNETVVIIDADGTYPCDAIPKMLDELVDRDLVIGTRNGGVVHMPMVRRPAKWLLVRLAEYIAGQPIPDLNSGLRAFRKSTVIPYFKLLSDEFSFTTTQTLSMMCDNHRLAHVPIDYYERKGKSKIVPWDFVNFVSLVLRMSMLFNPLKVFVPVSLLLILLSGVKLAFDIIFAIHRVGWSNYSVFAHYTVSVTALMLFLTGIQILLIGMMSDGLSRKIEQHGAVVKNQRESTGDGT